MEPKDLKYGELYIDDGILVCYIDKSTDKTFHYDVESYKFIRLDNTDKYFTSGWSVERYVKPL